jgi:hypothetical protein
MTPQPGTPPQKKEPNPNPHVNIKTPSHELKNQHNPTSLSPASSVSNIWVVVYKYKPAFRFRHTQGRLDSLESKSSSESHGGSRDAEVQVADETGSSAGGAGGGAGGAGAGGGDEFSALDAGGGDVLRGVGGGGGVQLDGACCVVGSGF